METRERILRAALRLFLEAGYEKASMNQIAREVGVSKPALYHHFSSKEELFRGVLALFFTEMGKWSFEHFHPCGSIRELLKVFFGSFTSMNREIASIAGVSGEEIARDFLLLWLIATKKDPGARRKIQEAFAMTRGRIEDRLLEARSKGEIRPDLDCETLAFQIHALMEGASLVAILDSSVDLDAMEDKMFRNLWMMVEA